MNADLSFGLWLKKRRKALDLTQSALAERVGCSHATIEKIESEERRPSIQIAELLAEALEIPPAERDNFLRIARRLRPTEGLATVSPISSPLPKTNLPIPRAPLVGRENELSGINHLLANADCRLISLIGPGGIGKTRLGIEFATYNREMFPSGIYYVPLASITSTELIVPAIAEAFDLSFSGPVDLKEQLFDYLAHSIGQPALLVLDNLEHLLAQSSAAADLVGEILQRFSNIRILCTSRERLNLQGEWIFDLQGLSVPPTDSDKLEEYSAVALFLQSAQRINAKFKLTKSERPALLHICQLLEGIPLALELAAAWVGMLSCKEIAREIESNIDFLATSMHNIPERHRSLKASFDHSWRLLSNKERAALSRLSVFHGGFDRVAAEKIAGATLPLLSSLAAKSLVRRTGDSRYDLHEVIRQYALYHLEEQPSQSLEARDAHSNYYLRFAAEREWALKCARQHEAMQELLGEMDNLRAAWAWSIQREQVSAADEAVRSLGWFFEVSGLIREGIEHFEPLIRALRAKPEDRESRRALGSALTQQGMLCFRKGFFDRAQALMEESLTILHALEEHALMTDSLIYLGVITHLNGDMERARELMEEGLEYSQAAGYDWFAAYAIYNLGYIASLQGNYVYGREKMLEGMAVWRRLGDPHSIALGLNYLGPTLVRLGYHDEARAFLQESLELCKLSGNRWGMGTAYRYLALVEMAQENFSEAQSLLQKSLETFGDYIVGWDIAKNLIHLGEISHLTGDSYKARTLLLDALRLARDIYSKPLILEALTGIASLEVRLNPDLAAGLLTLTLNHPAATHFVKEHAARLRDELPSTQEPESKWTIEAALEELLNS